MALNSIEKFNFQPNCTNVDCTGLELSDEALSKLITESMSKALEGY